MFSRTCEYALQAVLYIALHNEKTVGLKEIVDSQNIPSHFLSKILQNLVRNKILVSIKGPNGGFVLNIDPKTLTLFKIVEVVDGVDFFEKCGIGLKGCSDKNPCPIHSKYKAIKQNMKVLLTEKNLFELCEDVKNGESVMVHK